MELQGEDAPCWEYRGEGAANVVLAYLGPDALLAGKVLRLRKSVAKGPVLEGDGSRPVLSEDEQMLWEEWPEIATATSAAHLQYAYGRHVICPLLGPEHVDPGIPVYVSGEFLKAVDEKIRAKRPPWRIEEGSLQFVGGMALLISDHSHFPVLAASVQGPEPVISVEIKPKCGFLPDAGLLGEHNSVKGMVSRFVLHQHLKHVQGKVSKKSHYCPLELYSGSRDRVFKAVHALFETPQNNLAVFVNGIKVYGNGVDSSRDGDPLSKLVSSVGSVIGAKGGNSIQVLEALVTDMLHHRGILNRLHNAQRLDSLDIEGAIHAYYNFMALPCKVCEGEQKESPPDAASLHSLSREESRKIVRDYLVAATAKDCGLMVTFQPHGGDEDCPGHHGIIMCSSTSQKYRFKIFFLDLDLKPLRKMPYYFKLDQEIVKAYLLQERQGQVVI